MNNLFTNRIKKLEEKFENFHSDKHPFGRMIKIEGEPSDKEIIETLKQHEIIITPFQLRQWGRIPHSGNYFYLTSPDFSFERFIVYKRTRRDFEK